MSAGIESINASELAESASVSFYRLFGYECQATAVAPGRVNLIGEHIDYNQGYVLPFAINRFTAISIGTKNSLNGNDSGNSIQIHRADKQETFEFTFGSNSPPPSGTWQSYVFGVVSEFGKQTDNIPPFDALIESTLPIGSGLSSSAALEVALTTALEFLTGTTLPPLEKALLCQRAEHKYAGVPCGIMDQFACTFSQPDSIILLDCVSLEHQTILIEDPDITFLVIDSGVKHTLSDDEYGKRRRECDEALKLLRKSSWRDITPENIDENQDTLGPILTQRSRHIVSEISRTLDAASALKEKDWQTTGVLMYQSHASLRDDFQVSCPELDTLITITLGLDSSSGIFGSRMTGAGFGGSTVTLLRASGAHSTAGVIADKYKQLTGIEASWFLTRPVVGANIARNSQRYDSKIEKPT